MKLKQIIKHLDEDGIKKYYALQALAPCKENEDTLDVVVNNQLFDIDFTVLEYIARSYVEIAGEHFDTIHYSVSSNDPHVGKVLRLFSLLESTLLDKPYKSVFEVSSVMLNSLLADFNIDEESTGQPKIKVLVDQYESM